MTKTLRAEVAIFTVLNMLDAAVTVWAVENGQHEANPIMGWFIARDPWLFFAVKVAAGLAIAAWVVRRRSNVLRIGCALIAAVLGWNAYALFLR